MAELQNSNILFLVLISFIIGVVNCQNGVLPLVINTWPFTAATGKAWDVIANEHRNALDAIEEGCSVCEVQQCDGSVGYGGSPDEHGETTLDAMIMDGITHDVGAVGSIRSVKSAISVARAVMQYTTHTLLVGELATEFAVDMGFTRESLTTNHSKQQWKDWQDKECQPNYRQNVSPDPSKQCGPYKPIKRLNKAVKYGKTDELSNRYSRDIKRTNHDTLGMLVIDKDSNIAGGVTTNGLNHKVPGRVGDSPIAGAGAYVDNDVGGAAGTGDGDVMMRFLPSHQTVENMRQGMAPDAAAMDALKKIIRYYPKFVGALVAATVNGTYGAACHGIPSFHFSVRSPSMQHVTVMEVPCV